MRILCTFPGRHGDILWSLPTVRAISETFHTPVDLQIGCEYAGLVPLLVQQPYIAHAWADQTWPGDRGDLREGWRAPRDSHPPVYDHIYDLGYRRWPALPLPLEIDQTVRVDVELPPLDLTRPWITIARPDWRWRLDVAFGFTDRWFELKHGIVELLLGERVSREDGEEIDRGGVLVRTRDDFRSLGLCSAGSRWETEANYRPTTCLEAARLIAFGRVFLGDCSALHVLAVALGIPAVIMEPEVDRLNGIFWPCGQDGPQVTLVKGLDHKPTFDARHVAEALEKALKAI